MSRSAREPWDFDYRPLVVQPLDAGPCDVVVATAASVHSEQARRAALDLGASVEEILARPPLFWSRVRGPEAIDAARVSAVFQGIGAPPRYVASARVGAQAWAPRIEHVRPAAADSWEARAAVRAPDPRDDGRWFLEAEGGGAAVLRADTGTGAGTRLAVIDDDAAGAEELDLDAEILIHLARPPRAQSHGALMVGWAAGAARASPPFRGVAPDTSPRLYLIPKPGVDVVSLPLAIVRAASDGADVILCATYVEGSFSAMLDDALSFAERAGRGGRGSVVVLPTGRETSSPPGSVHASLSLSIGDPAADPRVLCVAPGGRGGGWFFYRDRKRLARPFANRGPSVRLLAPGDDMAYPLGGAPRLSHAESSGASAIAAGVAALVIANNPALEMREVLQLLEVTATPVDPAAGEGWAPFADRHDTLPSGADPDGHNAKHGYGALHARRACLAAADPVAWALVRVGEADAAGAYMALRREDPIVRAAYSSRLAGWIVRALLCDARASHEARAVARHVRLITADARRRRASPPGALARHVALILRGLLDGAPIGRPPRSLRVEIEALLASLMERLSVEEAWLDLAERLFAQPDG